MGCGPAGAQNTLVSPQEVKRCYWIHSDGTVGVLNSQRNYRKYYDDLMVAKLSRVRQQLVNSVVIVLLKVFEQRCRLAMVDCRVIMA